MGAITKIEWCHHTFNPWIGCTKVSAGCANCYAETLMDTRWGKVKWGESGQRVRTSPENWAQVRRWNKAAAAAGERHRVFVASLADVFEDRPELERWRIDLMNLIYECPALDFLLLTKRPDFACECIAGTSGAGLSTWPELFPNVWVGTSIENQATADERIPHLLRIPAAVKFLSCEPLLDEIDLTHVGDEDWDVVYGWKPRSGDSGANTSAVDWVIIGGESGKGARDYVVDWAEKIIDQCERARVPCFHKQLGSRPMIEDVSHTHGWPESDGPVNWETGRIRLNDRKGGDPDEWPPHLRVRQFPQRQLTTSH